MPQPTQNLVGVLLVNADGTQNSLYPLGDKFPNVEQITAVGVDIGNAPTVLFHCRVTGGDLTPVLADSPEVGEWHTLTNSGGLVSRTSVVNGRPWMTLRDPSRDTETTENKTQASFLIPASQRFYISYRLADDPTKIMVGALSVGAPVTQTTSLSKFVWMTNDANTSEYADIVVGTWNGGGSYVDGNTNGPRKASNGNQYYYPSLGGKPFAVGSELCRGYYQSGQESSAGAKDAWIELFQSSIDGTSIAGELGNPYHINNAGTGLTKFDYDEVFWGAYFGQLGLANFANVQTLGADFVVSSSRSRIVAANNAVLASATLTYDLLPLTWNNTTKVITYALHDREQALPYRHLIIDSNPVTACTIVQNVSYASI